jgi:hypothetical protein
MLRPRLSSINMQQLPYQLEQVDALLVWDCPPPDTTNVSSLLQCGQTVATVADNPTTWRWASTSRCGSGQHRKQSAGSCRQGSCNSTGGQTVRATPPAYLACIMSHSNHITTLLVVRTNSLSIKHETHSDSLLVHFVLVVCLCFLSSSLLRGAQCHAVYRVQGSTGVHQIRPVADCKQGMQWLLCWKLPWQHQDMWQYM